MASGLYDAGREAFLGGNIDADTDTLGVVLIDTGTYTVDLATHDNYDDLSGVVGSQANLASVTITDGILDAADLVFSAVSGNSVEAIVIFKDTGTASTDTLIAYIDGFSAVTPNGGDITVAWDNGANKIFKL